MDGSAEVAATLRDRAQGLESLAEVWPDVYEGPRQAAIESAAILRDAALELLTPPKKKAARA